MSFESVLFPKSHSSPGSWSIISVMLEFASIYIFIVCCTPILAYNVCKSEMSCSYIKAAIRKQLKKKRWVFSTKHSNFTDCPLSILFFIYLRSTVTIPLHVYRMKPLSANILINFRRSDDENTRVPLIQNEEGRLLLAR